MAAQVAAKQAGAGFGVSGGFRVSGFRVSEDLGFRVEGLGLQGFRVSGF